MKNKIFIAGIGVIALLLGSCNDFLDHLPDTRTELDSEEKVAKILVAAYADNTHFQMAELSSDNNDDYGENHPYTTRFLDQVSYWQEVTETDNDGPYFVWVNLYNAIANANQALQAIEEMDTPESLLPYKGEALLARAYAHFILVNMFCKHYRGELSRNDLGIPYMEVPETELTPTYERGNVYDVYKKIENDLRTGLPLIQDASYSVPKYHFNRQAALAFAARFYLFMGGEIVTYDNENVTAWEKVIEYTNQIFGSQPASLMRNWQEVGAMTQDWDVYASEYIKETVKTNFLLKTAVTQMSWPPYWPGFGRFAHGSRKANEETFYPETPWGTLSNTEVNDVTYGMYVTPFGYFANNHNMEVIPKLPYLFEYIDPVAQTGYRRTVTVEFSGDLAILDRAEAYVMLGEYDRAVEDLNTWVNSLTNKNVNMTSAEINAFFGRLEYYNPPEVISIKHQLSPNFTLEEGMQENMIQMVLHCRRIQTLGEGHRWFDVKRYGIVVYRCLLEDDEAISARSLGVDDDRRALQLPSEVIAAGLTPNPRLIITND